MLRHRKVLLAVSIVLVGGSISSTLAYAAYLHSDSYRCSVESALSAYLQLPADVERVTARSRRSRQFSGISLWLPQRTSQIFFCARSVWRTERLNGRARNALDIHDGWFLLGTGRFSSDDYRQILHSGLGHDFSELELSSVNLYNMDIVWRQPDLELRVEGASGEVLLDGKGTGTATLSAGRLNGVDVTEPINVRARFTPGRAIRFHNVALEVPRIPLESLALDGVLGTRITRGWFDGTLVYRQEASGHSVTLRGAVGEAQLEELTRRLPGGPFSGRANVDLSEATFTRNRLLKLVFNGELADIGLGQFAALLDQPDLDGQLTLLVHQGRYAEGRLAHLSASAEAADVSMAAVTRLLGRGIITGTLRVTVNSLLVVEDSLRWADVDLEVVPPAGQTGTIDREVILYAAEKVFGVDLGRVSDLLPRRVEYARMGCKLLVEHDRVTVKGSHGSDGRTILTVQVLGGELGILRQPDRSYPIEDPVELVRRRVTGYDVDRLLDEWDLRK